MKLPIISTILVLLLSQNSIASNQQPENCPAVSALQAVGISEIKKENDKWNGYTYSEKYGTSNLWDFGIGNFTAENENIAKQQALVSLSRLGPPDGPYEVTGGWLCTYNDHAGHVAVLLTPQMNKKSIAKFINQFN